jgi:hypothetical protein
VLSEGPGFRAPPEVARQLVRLERHARTLDWPAFRQAAQALRRDPRLAGEARAAVAQLEHRARRLAAWQQMRLLLHGPWGPPPAASSVKQALDETADKVSQGAREWLEEYLACRAWLEGRPELARALRRREAGPKEAAALLRDLARLEKAAGNQARPPADKDSLGAVGSVLGPLLPEPPALSVRPAVRESLRADLPTLEKLATAEKKARANALQTVEDNARLDWHHCQLHLRSLARFQRPSGGQGVTATTRQEPGQSQPLGDPTAAAVTEQVGRPLSAAEEVLVRHLRPKRPVEEIAAVLRKAKGTVGGTKEGKR